MKSSTHINHFLLISLASILLSACGGGSGGTATNQSNKITVSACSYVVGDNIYDNTDPNLKYSTIYTKSHNLGTPKPVYHIFNTRKLADNSDVTLDYMVHDYNSPKGVIILIAGGNLRARIQGVEGQQPTNSSGNFVVRSAHRYQAAGYRVITIDRPLDAVKEAYGGTTGVDIDKYRNSMQHAVDIANILKRENIEGYDVIISGTSRGTISASAMNTLAAGIAMSSPLTSGLGFPVGSNSLPLSRIKRPTHIMLHSNDTCSVTLPADSRTLFNNLDTAGIKVVGDEVLGGFRDDGANANVCGAFDYHGYNGIETCAVQKETIWANNLITGFAGNKAPIANNQTIALGNAITLTATDANGDILKYAVPYGTTSLGGTVVTDSAGSVTYTKPIGVTATTDSFAFTVTDGNGGVSTAVISITLP